MRPDDRRVDYEGFRVLVSRHSLSTRFHSRHCCKRANRVCTDFQGLAAPATAPRLARPINVRRPRLGAKAKLRDLPLGSRALAEVERETIRQTLKEAYTDRTAAAKALGIAVSTLYEKIKKYGL